MKRQLELPSSNNESTTKKSREHTLVPSSLKSTREFVDKLVPDNWAHIFSFLDPTRDLMPNLMPVCKMFYQVLGGGDGDEICKSLVYERVSIGSKDGYPTNTFLKIRQFDTEYMNRLLGYIIKVSPKQSCRVLHLGREGSFNDCLVIGYSIDFFKRCIASGVFDRLKELSLSSAFSVFLKEEEGLIVFKEWISRLKDLEKLTFSYLFPSDVLDCVFSNCLNLKELKTDLGGYVLQDSFPILEKLESFEFSSHCDSFSSMTLINLFKHAPNLRKLKLGYSMSYENAIFISLAEQCKNLTELTFGERYLHETDNVPIITNRLLGLETLVFVDGSPYGEHLLELDKLTKLKKFEFNISEFRENDEGYTQKLFKKIGNRLTWATYSYIKPEEGEVEEEEEEDEEGDEEKAELSFTELANKNFPNLQILEVNDSELEEVTLTQLFQEIPNLKEITVEVLTEGCDKVFDSIEEDVKVRRAASTRLLELFGEENSSVELFDHRVFYHRIGDKKLRIKITNIDYDDIVTFKINLV